MTRTHWVRFVLCLFLPFSKYQILFSFLLLLLALKVIKSHFTFIWSKCLSPSLNVAKFLLTFCWYLTVCFHRWGDFASVLSSWEIGGDIKFSWFKMRFELTYYKFTYFKNPQKNYISILSYYLRNHRSCIIVLAFRSSHTKKLGINKDGGIPDLPSLSTALNDMELILHGWLCQAVSVAQ